jgi:Ser/Thr protein kinase RdoA (MazF antagonist)
MLNMAIQETIPKKHLVEIGKRYGIIPQDLKFVGGFENSVYSFSKNKQDFFLRIGNSKHMTSSLVEAEIDWVHFLVERGVPAVKPVTSVNEQQVEMVSIDNESYNIVAFEKAEGDHVDHRNPLSWNSEMVRDWGKVIGKMHSVTKDYKPRSSRRYEFNPGLDSFLYKKESKEIRNYIDGLFQQLCELPKTRDTYGLVHSDIHTGNFFVKDNKISTILDFDRACYKWFISEIAIALFYPLYLTQLRSEVDSQKKFVGEFLPIFLEGYETENNLKSEWFSYLDLFLRIRDAILLMYAPNEDWRKPLRSRMIGKEPYLDVLELIS